MFLVAIFIRLCGSGSIIANSRDDGQQLVAFKMWSAQLHQRWIGWKTGSWTSATAAFSFYTWTKKKLWMTNFKNHITDGYFNVLDSTSSGKLWFGLLGISVNRAWIWSTFASPMKSVICKCKLLIHNPEVDSKLVEKKYLHLIIDNHI